jgi:GNAT superfamily N-acetyltransferase
MDAIQGSTGFMFRAKLKAGVKRASRLVLSRYTRVVVVQVGASSNQRPRALAAAGERNGDDGRPIEVRESVSANGREFEFSIVENGVCVCTCTTWTGSHHPDSEIVTLTDGQFMLGALKTLDEYRGKGYATSLMRYVTRAMFRRGFAEGVAVIWHNNEASLQAFRKSGWQPFFNLVLIHVKGMPRALRLERRRGARPSLAWLRK